MSRVNFERSRLNRNTHTKKIPRRSTCKRRLEDARPWEPERCKHGGHTRPCFASSPPPHSEEGSRERRVTPRPKWLTWRTAVRASCESTPVSVAAAAGLSQARRRRRPMVSSAASLRAPLPVGGREFSGAVGRASHAWPETAAAPTAFTPELADPNSPVAPLCRARPPTLSAQIIAASDQWSAACGPDVSPRPLHGAPRTRPANGASY